MRAITQIGEVGIRIEGARYLLRPSLAAMASLSDPVAAFAALHGDDLDDAREAAQAVFAACCEDDILQHVGMQQIGDTVTEPDGRGGVVERRQYADHYVDDIHLIAIARSLMFHGLIGSAPKRQAKGAGGKFSDTFDATGYAATAMALLGLSSAEAWQLTMTELLQALHVKYPPTKAEQSQAEALADYDRATAWRDSIYGGKNG